MKKICFLSDNFIDEMGGEQHVLVNIINILSDAFEIDLYCRFKSKKKSFYQLNPNVHIIDLSDCPPIKSKSKLSGALRWINFRTAFLDTLHLKSVMKHIKYSEKIASPWIALLNARNYNRIIGLSGFWGIFMMIYGDRIQAKCYAWFHNTYDAYFKSKKKYLCGYKTLLNDAQGNLEKLIVLTEKDQKCYSRFHNIPTCAIPNPISFVSTEKSSLQEKKLLFVGRLSKNQKGLDYLVSVLEHVFAKNTDWSIEIIGDGDDMPYLKQEIEERQWSDRVRLLGNQNNVMTYYLNASVFLLTSRWEGFGLVVTEAMECGLPVVSFATSGPSEIITDGADGFLIPRYDTNAFAEKILYLMEHEEERLKMGHSAAERAKFYSKENIRKMWIDLLEDRK